MPPPASLTRPARAPKTAPRTNVETDAERRARHLDMLRELAELNMQAARVAAVQVAQADPGAQAAASPTLDLARATRAVAQIIALENRIVAGEPARSAPATHDPRRLPLRQALHKTADAEPDRAARARLCRMIDDRIEEELDADPDQDLPITEALIAIADDLGLRLDCSQLPDELLGIPPRAIQPSPGSQFCTPPPGPEPPNIA